MVPKDGLPYRHGIHEAMGVLTGQWVTAILSSLAAKPMTYSELHEDINDTEERLGWGTRKKPLTNKVLTETLRRMQRDGLLAKVDRPKRFGNTWYGLTPEGRSLLRALRPLAKWAEDNREHVRRSRASHLGGRSESPDEGG
jgi:DNA-binding HxlR family transcriptional regulator